MKVKQLIKQLQIMPQNLEVYTTSHDNASWETGSYTTAVGHYVKEDLRKEFDLDNTLGKMDMSRFEANDKEWVAIHG